MRLSTKYIYYGSLILGILSWLALVYLNYLNYFLSLTPQMVLRPPEVIIGIIYISFISFNMLFIDMSVRKIKNWSVIDLLWKLPIIGFSGLAVSGLTRAVLWVLDLGSLIDLAIPLDRSIRIYALLVFFSSAIFIFRKLIYYNKTKKKVLVWRTFQGVMVIAILMLFDAKGEPGNPFAIQKDSWGEYIRAIIGVLFFLCTVFLSSFVNWTAYLNRGQKLRTIALLIIIISLFILYDLFLPFELFRIKPDSFLLLFFDSRYIFFVFIFYFPLLYALFSLLVVFFNLPTSSVFEQYTSEIASLQKLSNTIHAKADREGILNTLLEAGLLISNSPIGWIELTNPTKNLARIGECKELEFLAKFHQNKDQKKKLIEEKTPFLIPNIKKEKEFRGVKTKFRSLASYPVVVMDKTIAIFFIGSDVTNYFERETQRSLLAITEQAGMAIQSSELAQYQEQVKIAQEFQEQILPKTLPDDSILSIHVISQDAEQIGGDYYDFHLIDNTYKIALGDVSGKGTRAAFYMAEVKGAFQSVALLDMDPYKTVCLLNSSVSNCFEKGHFFTLIYLQINPQNKLIEIIRAGHCPALYYKASEDKLEYLDEGGLGLGIVRNDTFPNFLPASTNISYQKDDFLVLYTDGIVEAQNAKGEEFGFELLKDLIFENRSENPEKLTETVLTKAKEFTGGKINDDYTILVIKLK